MNNKGYTIMEAVIAMFLVVVMVGTVFSALMSSRRAIIASSEKEEVLYSLNSSYALLKDCRSNPNCHLKDLSCNYNFSDQSGTQDWKTCNELFTFNYKNLCLNSNDEERSKFNFKLDKADGPLFHFTGYDSDGSPVCVAGIVPREFYSLNIDARCTEE